MVDNTSNSHGRNTQPLRVLIVRVGAMGDVLHAMPGVAALRAAVPACEIGWAIEPRWASLLQADGRAQAISAQMPLVDRVHAVPTREWSARPFSAATLQSVLTLRRELRRERYDVCIDLQGTIRSAVIGRMAGAHVFAGSDTPRERQARWLYGMRIKTSATHVIEQAAEIVSAAMQTVDAPLITAGEHVALPVDEAATRWCEGLLGSDMRRVVVISPAAGWGAKQWPAERYGEVAARLAASGYRVLVNAVPGRPDALAEAVVAAGGGAAQAVGCTIGELTSLLRRSSLLIGGDTGPMHLASALHVPVLALFGPTDPARTGPYGSRAVVLRSATSVVSHKRYSETEAGLLKIGVEDVMAATIELLDASFGASASSKQGVYVKVLA